MNHLATAFHGANDQKQRAAIAAVEMVQSGMRLGLGTGSTAAYAIAELGARLADGRLKDVRGVPTSLASAALAERHGVLLMELGAQGVDLAIDGMDELDPALNAIKGLGGALAREKIVAARADCFVLVGDASKRVSRLGEKAPVPVEVLPFGWRAAQAELEALGCAAVLRTRRESREPFVSDNGNLVLDCRFEKPFDAPALAGAIDHVVGVVEHGLFLGMADVAFVATDSGVLQLPS
ncbi:MAG TPA: ribose-5-phosphate isomerase RpiA [Trueperaceae bacterium]